MHLHLQSFINFALGICTSKLSGSLMLNVTTAPIIIILLLLLLYSVCTYLCTYFTPLSLKILSFCTAYHLTECKLLNEITPGGHQQNLSSITKSQYFCLRTSSPQEDFILVSFKNWETVERNGSRVTDLCSSIIGPNVFEKAFPAQPFLCSQW